MSEADGYNIDRSEWLPGPWDGEADREEWRSGGYPCLVVRAPVRPGGMFGFCTYKDMAYVKREVERLREQAERAKSQANAHRFPKWPEE